jgi:hypothetical protein
MYIFFLEEKPRALQRNIYLVLRNTIVIVIPFWGNWALYGVTLIYCIKIFKSYHAQASTLNRQAYRGQSHS